MQHKAVYFILQVHSTCFGCSATPIIRITQNCNYSLRYWSYFFAQISPSNVANLAILEAVVTVLCSPDDGCG